MALDDLVEVAFQNARENGFTFEGWTDYSIAIDMMMCDYDISVSGASEEEVTAAVRQYREKSR